MSVTCKRIAFILVILLASFLASNSEEKHFERINMVSGLSHNSALCILEDHDGFVWIGTRDGLNRYDGINIQIYKHVFFDSTSLVNNQINCLFETLNQNLWVGTANGLCMYDHTTGKFSNFPLKDDKQPGTYYVRTICETYDQKLWVGTTRGLFVIDKTRKSFKRVPIEAHQPDIANNIRKIFQDSKGTIWIGTNQGLYRKNNDTFEHYLLNKKLRQPREPVREIAEDETGRLWIGTESSGVYVLNTSSNHIHTEFSLNSSNSSMRTDIVRSIYFEDDENVWIGTFGVLYNYNLNSNQITQINSNTSSNSNSNNSVYDIYSDSSGGIWVALYWGGVRYYHHQKNMFDHKVWHSNAAQLSGSNIVSALLEDDENNLWIGTEGGGLFRSADEGNTIDESIHFEDFGVSENTIKAIARGTNNIWVGTLVGVSSFNPETKKIKSYHHIPGEKNSLNAGHVLALYYENQEKIWIGTNGGGVQIFNPEEKKFKTVESLSNQHVSCFFSDSKKRLWIGCEESIFLFDNGNFIDLSKKIEDWGDGITDVTFITEDSQSNYWIGTRGMGLYLVRNNKLFWFNTNNGLIDNTINSLLEGETNQYWITSNKGLSRIQISEQVEEPQIFSHTYSASQGVQGLQFSPKCALKSNAGKLFFGGINGMNSFDPADIIENDLFPELVLKDFRIDYKLMEPGVDNSPLNKVLNETGELILRYTQRDFSISFAGINFINPDKNVYRYKVIGLNDSWIEMGRQSNINFTYFPIGTYEIQLQVSTNPQNWGTEYRSLLVTVLPPWWKTWWAFVIYSFVLAILLALFFFLSQRWARMKNQLEMEHFQREKESELHQLKLKFYTDVSHELRTPLTLILAPLENLISKTELPIRFRNQLTQIQRSGLRLMQLVNQILDLRKLETGHESLQVAEGNITRFFSEISLAFKEVALSRSIAFEFNPGKDEQILWYDRDKLEIIINNLLSNALKFTPEGGKVQLRFKEVKGLDIQKEFEALNRKINYLQIEVCDNGEGLTKEQIDNIFNRYYSKNTGSGSRLPSSGVGLELSRRMAELHKGGIQVTSNEISSGKKETVFLVYLSLDKNIYTPEELDIEFKNSEDPSLYTAEFLQRETIMAAQEEEPDAGVSLNDEFERLLIVEDNPEVRSFVKELFANDYEISEAENGESGLQKAIETNPQLIISDVMMPVMDGIELCRKIKTDARTSHIPVILLTARTALTFKYEGLETGADDYITKPFSARYLALRVKNLIKQRKSIQEHFKREAICDPGSITLTSVDEKILKKAVDFITENISDPGISVNKISEHVGLSRVHFYRKIKALTNQTAVEFIRSIRIKRAATLLAQNKLSIKEVRNMTGFEDADYFRKCFKEQFGVTPSEYQKD